MRNTFELLGTLALLLPVAQLTGCATAPPDVDRGTFDARADSSTDWFIDNVSGLENQINNSAGYIIFPDVTQWGILFAGGTWGRGGLYSTDGELLGWSAINKGSIGLQAGVQGLRMLFVLQNQAALENFKANKWTGSAEAVAVAAEAGRSAQASFSNGVAVYQGANSGLMAGANVGLEYIRFQPLEAE